MGVTSAPVDARLVRAWVARLASDSGPSDDSLRIDLLTALEELKCAAEGLQADLAVDLEASTRQREADSGVPSAQRGRGVAATIALARRTSPHRGQRLLGLATVLHTELPHTRAALRAGRTTEWRATIVARETACLSREHRLQVDERVASDAGRLEAMGDRELGDAVRRMAYELDAAAWVTRRRIAESERRVTLRPAPDVMSRLSAELPVAQGVAVFRALSDHADSLRSSGDPRSRSQLMADTLVTRLLGIDQPTALPVTLHVVVSDDVLFGHHDDAAHLDGAGAVPAELARELAVTADAAGLAELRRLYATPETGALVAADSGSRFFPHALGLLIELRDQTCRTPWCDAPIRHHDHIVGAVDDGPTSLTNGQGLCEACNYAKQPPGWRARPSPGDRHTVAITTPTGHTYRSAAPPLPGRTRLRVDVRYPAKVVA